MNIGDSEFPGGTTVYCSPDARSSPSQGVLPGDFWTDIEYAIGQGSGKYVQRQCPFLDLRLFSLTTLPY